MPVDDANDPAVHVALMSAKQRLEGVEVVVTKLPQYFQRLFQHSSIYRDTSAHYDQLVSCATGHESQHDLQSISALISE
jgi:hypothetical protein